MKFELTFREQYSTFPTQGLNPLLLPLWADSSPAEPQGKPKSTIVGSLSLPQQSFQPRTWTGVCCIAGVLYRIIREASYIESEVAQSCLTLCDPLDGSPPGSSARGILQARTLEWVSSSRESSRPRNHTSISCTGRRIPYCWAIGGAKIPHAMVQLSPCSTTGEKPTHRNKEPTHSDKDPGCHS